MGVKLASIGLLVVVGGLASGSASGGGLRSSAGRSGVVLTSRGGGIVAVNVDGSGIGELIHSRDGADDHDAVASPDGSMIAFRRDSKRAGIYVMSADGTNLRRVGPGVVPAWSPDGGFLAASTGARVYVMKPDGTSARTIGRGDFPVWSPDGQWLAYEGDLGNTRIVRLDGTKSFSLPKASYGGWVVVAYSWSAFGRLAYTSAGSLWVIDPTTGESHVVVRRRALGDGPGVIAASWSPDGDRIAFSFFDESTYTGSVYVVKPDGSSLRRVGPGTGGRLVWSPDGTRLTYSTYGSRYGAEASAERVVVVDAAAGRTLWRLRPIAGEASVNPSWSPDGTELVFERGNVAGSDPGIDYPADLWVVAADGSGASRLTEAFPFTGVAGEPAWWPGRAAVAPDPPLPTVALQTVAKGRARKPFGIAGTDGTRLAVWGYYSGLRVSYDGGRGAWKRTRGGGDSVAFSGKRLYFASNDREESYLTTAAGPRSRERTLRSSGGDRAGQHFTVASDRSLVAFTVGRWLWRIRGTRTRRIRYERRQLNLADIDRGRILLLRSDRRLELVNAKGRLLRSFSSRGDNIQDGRLSGRRVVAVGTRRILVFDARTGHLRASWPVGAPGLPPNPAGFIYKSLLPYSDGSALHVLDVGTGHDLVVRIHGVTEPVDGAITKRGLLYTWTATYSRWEGRLGLVPLKNLRAALRAVPTG
jgi:Tol biopolymer transport system component